MFHRYVIFAACSDREMSESHVPFSRKCTEALRYGLVDMVGNVGKWLVIGLVIAALITVLVPDELFLGLADYPLLYDADDGCGFCPDVCMCDWINSYRSVANCQGAYSRSRVCIALWQGLPPILPR